MNVRRVHLSDATAESLPSSSSTPPESATVTPFGTTDAGKAKLVAPALYAELTRPKGKTVGELWAAYEREYEGRAVLETMKHTQKALKARFWHRKVDTITVEDCKAHIKEPREAGIRDWTICTELSHISNVCGFAAKRKLIGKAPFIFRPPQPKRKEDKHLTREQVRALINVATLPHARLAAIAFYTMAARSAALCVASSGPAAISSGNRSTCATLTSPARTRGEPSWQ
jgi:hypothetical protein